MAKDVVNKAMLAIQKQFGENAAVRLGTERASASAVVEVIPTGVEVVDYYLCAVGGLPVGRMSEWAGEEGCGKTSFMYQAIAKAQSCGARIVVIDAEYTFDENRARVFGVVVEDVLVLQPETLEQAFESLKTALKVYADGEAPLLIWFDTLAACKPKVLLDAAAGDAKIAAVAWLCSQEFPKIMPMLKAARAHLAINNQLRVKLGVMFGDNTVTSGGKAIAYYASLRFQFFGGKPIKNGEKEHTGKEITLFLNKTRFSPPFRKARLRFDYDSGYVDEWCTLEHAKRFGKCPLRARGAAAHAQARVALGWASGEGDLTTVEPPTSAGELEAPTDEEPTSVVEADDAPVDEHGDDEDTL